MTVTMNRIPVIINDLKKRKPPARAKNSDKPLSAKEAVMQLASTILAKKEEVYTSADLVDVLAQHDIIVKPHKLTRYLREHIAATAKPQVEPEPSSSEHEANESEATTSSEGCHQ
jgi:hypothetical protein